MAFTDDGRNCGIRDGNQLGQHSDEGTDEMVEKITLQEGQKLLERSLLFLEQQDTDFDIDSNELLMMRRLLRETADYRYSKNILLPL